MERRPDSRTGPGGVAAAPAVPADRGCAVCGREPLRVVGADLPLADLPDIVCPACDARARDEGGTPASIDPATGAGANPVFVDGRRCWRVYRFGGWVTLLDRGAGDLADFLDRAPA